MHCEICGVKCRRLTSKQRFCAKHATSMSGLNKRLRDQRIAKLKEKYSMVGTVANCRAAAARVCGLIAELKGGTI